MQSNLLTLWRNCDVTSGFGSPFSFSTTLQTRSEKWNSIAMLDQGYSAACTAILLNFLETSDSRLHTITAGRTSFSDFENDVKNFIFKMAHRPVEYQFKFSFSIIFGKHERPISLTRDNFFIVQSNFPQDGQT